MAAMKRRLINRRPDRAGLLLLGALPFLLAVICYFGFSAWRLAENPRRVDEIAPKVVHKENTLGEGKGF